MRVVLKHGPLDGAKMFLLVDTETIAVKRKAPYLYYYRRTLRVVDGCVVFQYLSLSPELIEESK